MVAPTLRINRTRVQTAIHCMETLRISTPKKARTSKSAGKFMFISFMDAHGLILQHAVPAGTTVQFKVGMLIYNIKTQVEFDLGYNPLIFDRVMGLL